MVFGISLGTFTLLHVLISLVTIGTGMVVLLGLIAGKRLDRWTAVFLATTAATSITGFGFPLNGITPPVIFGIVSLIVLGLASVARYRFGLAGAWRRTYVINASIALYLNVFVLVVQSFQKIGVLHALAPTQSEAPFAVAQLLVLAMFGTLTLLADARFRGTAVSAVLTKVAHG